MNPRRLGFTLIEVLLSLFITAILITILSVVFNTGLRSYRQGKDLLEITRKGQLILGQMTRELVGAVVQENYISFIGNKNSVYFMAPVKVEKSSEKGVDLCEIGYIFDATEQKIKRHFITANAKPENYEYPGDVDYINDTDAPDEFCNNVIDFMLQYHGGTNWQDKDNPWGKQYKLPTMIEVKVTIQGEYPKNKPKQAKTFTTWIYLPNSTNNP